MKNTKAMHIAKFLLFSFFFSAIFLSFLWLATPEVSADDLWNNQIGMDTKSGEVGDAFGEKGSRDNVRDIRIVVANIVRVVLGFIGIILTILIIWAGFLWMTSSGNADQVTKAKGTLIRAVVGLVIVLAAFALASFVIEKVQDSVVGGVSYLNNVEIKYFI